MICFAEPGDSGSFVYTEKGEVVGMLLAGSETAHAFQFQHVADGKTESTLIRIRRSLHNKRAKLCSIASQKERRERTHVRSRI